MVGLIPLIIVWYSEVACLHVEISKLVGMTLRYIGFVLSATAGVRSWFLLMHEICDSYFSNATMNVYY